MSDALEAFRVMPERNTKAWNTLIDGFAQNRKHKEALGIFEQMSDGVTPDAVTLDSVLSACAQLGDLPQARGLHSYIKSHVIRCDTIFTNSLINMYAKCGNVAAAEDVFLTYETKGCYFLD
jgi:pentatricopeptide repeat protein